MSKRKILQDQSVWTATSFVDPYIGKITTLRNVVPLLQRRKTTPPPPPPPPPPPVLTAAVDNVPVDSLVRPFSKPTSAFTEVSANLPTYFVTLTNGSFVNTILISPTNPGPARINLPLGPSTITIGALGQPTLTQLVNNTYTPPPPPPPPAPDPAFTLTANTDASTVTTALQGTAVDPAGTWVLTNPDGTTAPITPTGIASALTYLTNATQVPPGSYTIKHCLPYLTSEVCANQTVLVPTPPPPPPPPPPATKIEDNPKIGFGTRVDNATFNLQTRTLSRVDYFKTSILGAIPSYGQAPLYVWVFKSAANAVPTLQLNKLNVQAGAYGLCLNSSPILLTSNLAVPADAGLWDIPISTLPLVVGWNRIGIVPSLPNEFDGIEIENFKATWKPSALHVTQTARETFGRSFGGPDPSFTFIDLQVDACTLNAYTEFDVTVENTATTPGNGRFILFHFKGRMRLERNDGSRYFLNGNSFTELNTCHCLLEEGVDWQITPATGKALIKLFPVPGIANFVKSFMYIKDS
ncbi:MAG: hypothetical protein [Sthenivirus nowtis]|uniref:Uncharacterized protein n=1 Tax=Cressdnaviricota sp. TaxID=2748378 RepID=A0A345MY58_9VIRU|nr:MAG: hypothetical protein [Cressdnaviricota sp.]